MNKKFTDRQYTLDRVQPTSHTNVTFMHAQKRCETLKTGSFCRCFSMERAVCGLKMMGEPVVSVLSSRSSEIPGASDPGAGHIVKVKVKIRCFI